MLERSGEHSLSSELEVDHMSTYPPVTARSRRARAIATAVAAGALLLGTAACGSSGGGSPSSSPTRGRSTPPVSSTAPAVTTPASTPATSSSSTASTGVDAAFLARVDHECALGNTYSSAHPFPYPNFKPSKPAVKDLPGVANYFKHSPDVVDKIIALGAPASGVAGWRPVVAALRAYAANQRKQVAAAAASDVKAFKATLTPAATDQQRLLLTATRAGLTGAHSCVTYFGS